MNPGGMSVPAGAAESEGPSDQGPVLPARQDGDVTLGRDVFRNETFGNEGFWTDAVRLPAGIEAARVTPMQALSLGLQVDVDAIDAATQRALVEQLRADPSGRSSALLNDPAVTLALVKAGAIAGMAPKGAKVGVTCALCHTMSGASGFTAPG
ncbi:MAG: hypothetical protein H7247_02600, partial [Polaromonas sp.]|nr:hypothetical protein [Gemmatimonadaceae bacterium]